MKATVIGCGRWGSFIAWYLRKIGHEVTLYGREGSRHIEQFCRTRTNGLVTLEDDVRITTNLREALESRTDLHFHSLAESAGFEGSRLPPKT